MRSRKSWIAVVVFVLIGNAVLAQSVDQGIQALKSDKYKTAKQIFQQAISAKANDDVAYYYLGLADLGIGNKDSAKADFQKGLQVNAKSALNTVGLARLDILDGQYDAGKQKLQQAFDLSDGRDFEVGRAILEATAQDPKADNAFAVSLMTQIKNNKKNKKKELTSEDFVALADAQAKIPGGAGDASANYENAFMLDPKNAQAYDRNGELLLSARAFDNALSNYNKAIEADPNYAPAYLHLYNYYISRYDIAKAKENIEKYMTLADDKVKAKVALVDLYYYEGQANPAGGGFQQAIALADSIQPLASEDDQTRLYKLKAVSEIATENIPKAKQDMDTYFQRTPDNKRIPFDYQTYGNILMKMNQADSANEYYAKSIAIDTTTNLDALREQAEKLRKQNNFIGAALYYQKIINIGKDQATVNDYFYNGFANFYANKYDTAVAIFKTMAEKFPQKENQAVAYFYWGKSLMAEDTASTGVKGLAVEPYTKYLSLINPADSSKKTQLTTVYYYLAASALAKSDFSQAGQYADKLTPLDPNIASQVYSNIAYNYSKQKDRPNATTYAQKALAVNPSDQTAIGIMDYYKQVDEYNEKMRKYNESKKKAGGQ